MVVDFNDFFAYNFPPHDNLPDHVPRPIIDDSEAVRLMIVKLHVVKIEPPGPEDGQSQPVVHFEGISRSLDQSLDDNADSDILGDSIKVTPALHLFPFWQMCHSPRDVNPDKLTVLVR